MNKRRILLGVTTLVVLMASCSNPIGSEASQPLYQIRPIERSTISTAPFQHNNSFGGRRKNNSIIRTDQNIVKQHDSIILLTDYAKFIAKELPKDTCDIMTIGIEKPFNAKKEEQSLELSWDSFHI